MISANHAATSASDAGDHGDGGTSPELLGTALQTVVCDGVWLYGELEEWRIHWWRRMELGWPKATATTTMAAAGVRATTGLMLQRASGLVSALGMLYGKLRTRRARRGDQMVTGATPAASSAEVSFGHGGIGARGRARGRAQGGNGEELT